ncbi:MAG: hypothetical protein AB2L14_22715 [Candidatus Xenobiia bacterium LiM19]
MPLIIIRAPPAEAIQNPISSIFAGLIIPECVLSMLKSHICGARIRIPVRKPEFFTGEASAPTRQIPATIISKMRIAPTNISSPVARTWQRIRKISQPVPFAITRLTHGKKNENKTSDEAISMITRALPNCRVSFV